MDCWINSGGILLEREVSCLGFFGHVEIQECQEHRRDEYLSASYFFSQNLHSLFPFFQKSIK